jgi:hypothetical protein
MDTALDISIFQDRFCELSRYQNSYHRPMRDEAFIENVSVIENQISLLCEEFEMTTGNFYTDSEDETVEMFHNTSEVRFSHPKFLVTRRLSLNIVLRRKPKTYVQLLKTKFKISSQI